jgi:hypothetical protein
MVSSMGWVSDTSAISFASSTIDSDVVNDGSTSRGMIDESRPENKRLGSIPMVGSESWIEAWELPVDEIT